MNEPQVPDLTLARGDVRAHMVVPLVCATVILGVLGLAAVLAGLRRGGVL